MESLKTNLEAGWVRWRRVRDLFGIALQWHAERAAEITRDPLPLNYCFWYAAFLFLSWLNYSSLQNFSDVPEKFLPKVYLIAALHTLIAVLVLALLDATVEKTVTKIGKFVSAGILSMIMLGFYGDYVLFGFMSIHLDKGLGLLVRDNLSQFWLAISATGFRSQEIVQFSLWMLALAVVGMALVRLTWKLSLRWPFKARPIYLLAIISGLLTAAFLLESFERSLDGSIRIWSEHKRVLPCSFGLRREHLGLEITGATLQSPRKRQEIMSALERVVIPPGKRPDIFIFVLESVRGDFVNELVTPNLSRLRRDCLPIQGATSSGNATQLSWYSIFTANFPFYLNSTRRSPELWGSTPLQLLSRAGYKIHVSSSASLAYYQIDQVLFGENLELTSSLWDSRRSHTEVAQQDRQTTQWLLRKLDEPSGGRMFVVFYDSTHHEYNWPMDFPPRFQPYAKSWEHTKLHQSNDELELIKNRYRNAVFYVDDLIGLVLRKLESVAQYHDSVIFITGDHGEEFMEHGKMLHATETCRIQTYVPFLLKIPQDATRFASARKVWPSASHVDFLPTLLDYLGIEVESQWDGESLFRKAIGRSLSASHNGIRDPHEFCLQVEDRKAWFAYRDDGTPIGLQRAIYLKKLTDSNDREITMPEMEQRQIIRGVFGPTLRRVYPQIDL